MKLIGLLGGMSWESSLEYYRIINQEIKTKLGGLSSAKLILYSVDFGEIGRLQHEGKWDKLTTLLTKAAVDLESIGAEGIVICTNTMHLIAEEMKKKISVPIIHIVKETGKKIKEKGLKKVGLLGTVFTMDSPLYKDFLLKEYNIKVIIPKKEKMKIINDIIYKELVLGKIEKSSKLKFIEIIDSLVDEGAEGIILGCTEIPLLIKQKDVQVPVFDTTLIHALSTVEFMIK